MAITALRGARLPLLLNDPKLPPMSTSSRLRKLNRRFGSPSIFVRYSQAQDISTRLQDGVNNLPKLVEDIVRASINTGPRGALRLAQGVQAVIGVGGEWLNDLSKEYLQFIIEKKMQCPEGSLIPLELKRKFYKMVAGLGTIHAGHAIPEEREAPRIEEYFGRGFSALEPTPHCASYEHEFIFCFTKFLPVFWEEFKDSLIERIIRPSTSPVEYLGHVPIAYFSQVLTARARLKSTKGGVVCIVLKPKLVDQLLAKQNFSMIMAPVTEDLSLDFQKKSIRQLRMFIVDNVSSTLAIWLWCDCVVGIVEDIKASMLEEVDFQKEAINIETFRRYLETMGLERQAKAPKVYQHCSTRRVLTMERLYGVPLTDLDSINSLVPDPEMTLVTALNVWFGSLIACETFHADVHAGNLWLLRDGRIGFLDFGIVGRISPKTWAAIEIFLSSFASEDYEEMASALIEMGATEQNVDVKAFARDLEKIFATIQDLDTEIIVATSRGPNSRAAVAANVVVDERQMNVLFLDVLRSPPPHSFQSTVNMQVRVSESYGLRFPREFALLLKQLLYFDRYTRLLAPNMNMLQDQRITILSNRRIGNN
ncbi:putative aarF domain-containing protein kinase [Dendrobium catenatum]|uniref:Putative aarF domain-containing protein kinase n=1 Tax=Dendrobium catenatum TaxID=906689 RepID=A0A2I0WVB0_9ASPA|nr:putative aarF domain-containing protein kinase [Dendrobium catenatum]